MRPVDDIFVVGVVAVNFMQWLETAGFSPEGELAV